MIRASFVLTLSRVLASLCQALSLIILARAATVSEFGTVNMLIALSTVFVAVADLGVGTWVLRNAQTGGDLRGAIRFNAWTSVAFGTAGVLLVFLFVDHRLAGANALLLIPAAYALEKNSDTLAGICLAHKQLMLVSAVTVIRRVLALGILALLLFAQVQPVVSFCVSIGLAALVAQILLRAGVRLEQGVEHGLKSRFSVKSSIPYFISNFSSQARQLDLPIVQALLGPSAAGLYAAPLRLVSPFMLAAVSVANIVLSQGTNIRFDGRRLSKRLGAITLLSVAVMAVIGLSVPKLLVLILGVQYSAAGAAAYWLCIALPVVAFATPFGAILQSKGEEKFVAQNGVTFAIVFLVLAVAGALVAGIQGAAIALVVAYGLKCIFLLLRLNRI